MTDAGPPRWTIAEGPDFMDRAAADFVAAALGQAIGQRGRALLAVSGGRTPEAAFEVLAAKPLDWSKVTVTLVDERWVDPKSEQSNEWLVRGKLLQRRAATARFLPMKSEVAPEAGAAAFAAALPAEPLDAVLLGMGEDGHFASLFPGSPVLAEGLDLASGARCIAVPAGDPAPAQARLSLTLAEIARAGLIVLLAKGAAKQRVLDRARDADPAELPVAALLAARRDVRLLMGP